jgi:hypothetical protein
MGPTKVEGIWKEQYGIRSQEFIDGVKAGVRMYATWKDGVERVGVQQQKLKDVLEQIQAELSGKVKADCYKCKHRGQLTGDTHSKCLHPKVLKLVEDPLAAVMGMMSRGRLPIPPSVGAQLGIVGNPHGIKKGWFNWPINFDPVWLENCNGFEPAKK